MEKQIETVVEMAANKYPLIHPDIDDYENEECILQRKAFIEGYKAANAAVQGYREALEKIAGGYYGKVAIVEMAAEALSKAEGKGEGARYTIDEIIGFINQEELTIPIEKFFREDGSHITKKEYGIVVLNELCIALKERFKPQPTNSLDELERWVAELLVSEVFEIDTLRLINKIQELKTITP
jgi:hypothetical protein